MNRGADTPGIGGIGDSQVMIRAANYIFNHDQVVGKPLVVNISLGDYLGAHDGSSQLEKAIDQNVQAHGNAAVVVASGNSRLEKSHTKGSIPASGPFDVKFTLSDNDTKYRHLDLWYLAGPSLNLTLKSPDGTILSKDSTHLTGVISADNAALHNVFPVPSGTSQVLIISQTAVVENGNNRIQVIFARGSRPSGEWVLSLSSPSSAAVDFHAWLQRGEADDTSTTRPAFSAPTEDSTLNIPATAQSAIAVGAYENRKNCCDCNPSEGILPYSSLGPVWGNATSNPKPNIAAPGASITTANAGACNLRGDCLDCCPNWCCCLRQRRRHEHRCSPRDRDDRADA
jgi:hypothetical protein